MSKKVSQLLFFSPRRRQKPTSVDKLNVYKIFWIFVFGGVFGYLYEGIYFFFHGGAWHGNTGVIYGCFNQIYGVGAAVILLILYSCRKQPWWVIFLLSSLLGGATEFIASWCQEKIFGYISWNYQHLPFNLAGRTTLPYMLIWGGCGLLLIKIIYPVFHRFWYQLMMAQIRYLTIFVGFFLFFDLSLSALAVWRMSQREQQLAPRNFFEIFLDQTYPNHRLKQVYPRLQLPQN